jgi:hypothetical protein
MRQFTEDRRKLKELILYVAQQCADKHNFGSTTLYKILYFSDHFAYGKFGEPITGAEYMKEKHGIIPRRVLPATQELEREGRLAIREIPLKGKRLPFKKPVAVVAPDLTLFTSEQIALVDNVIERFRRMSTKQVRKYAHESAVFHSFELKETIPYETIFVHREQRLTPAEIKLGQELAKRHGWTRSERF